MHLTRCPAVNAGRRNDYVKTLEKTHTRNRSISMGLGGSIYRINRIYIWMDQVPIFDDGLYWWYSCFHFGSLFNLGLI